MREEQTLAEIEDFIEGFNQPTFRGIRVNGVRVGNLVIQKWVVRGQPPGCRVAPIGLYEDRTVGEGSGFACGSDRRLAIISFRAAIRGLRGNDRSQ